MSEHAWDDAYLSIRTALVKIAAQHVTYPVAVALAREALGWEAGTKPARYRCGRPRCVVCEQAELRPGTVGPATQRVIDEVKRDIAFYMPKGAEATANPPAPGVVDPGQPSAPGTTTAIGMTADQVMPCCGRAWKDHSAIFGAVRCPDVTSAAAPQPAPRPGRKMVLPLVIRDLHDRADAGRQKYGTFLYTENGRDALMDAYQEALDLVMYLRQAIEERGPAGSARVPGVRP